MDQIYRRDKTLVNHQMGIGPYPFGMETAQGSDIAALAPGKYFSPEVR